MVWQTWDYEGIWISFSEDLVEWLPPQLIIKTAPGERDWYATVIGETDRTAGQNAVIYYAWFPDRTRADRHDLGDAGSVRRNCGHQQRGGKWIAAGGDITSDAIERHDTLLNGDSSGDTRSPPPRHLAACHRAAIARRRSDRRPDGCRNIARRASHFVEGDLDGAAETVELARVASQRPVAGAAHVGNDLLHASLGRLVADPLG